MLLHTGTTSGCSIQEEDILCQPRLKAIGQVCSKFTCLWRRNQINFLPKLSTLLWVLYLAPHLPQPWTLQIHSSEVSQRSPASLGAKRMSNILGAPFLSTLPNLPSSVTSPDKAWFTTKMLAKEPSLTSLHRHSLVSRVYPGINHLCNSFVGRLWYISL